MALGGAARCLLGNHDLSLLAVAHGRAAAAPQRHAGRHPDGPDRAALLDWLRHQRWRQHRLHAHGLLMVHAGVLPSWTVAQTLALAGEVEAVLRSPALAISCSQMYGNEPDHWDDSLTGANRCA
jgi:bis(5'-nucleosyl)-tetraphosphatase (symmetrical)